MYSSVPLTFYIRDGKRIRSPRDNDDTWLSSCSVPWICHLKNAALSSLSFYFFSELQSTAKRLLLSHCSQNGMHVWVHLRHQRVGLPHPRQPKEHSLRLSLTTRNVT